MALVVHCILCSRAHAKGVVLASECCHAVVCVNVHVYIRACPQSVVISVQDHLAVAESPVLVEPLIHCLVAIGKSYKRELQPCFKVCRLTCGRALLKGKVGAGGGAGAAGNCVVCHC